MVQAQRIAAAGDLEQGQEAVAHRLDLLAPEGRQGLADAGVVGGDLFQPATVAELGGQAGGDDDVGEEDRADPAADSEAAAAGSAQGGDVGAGDVPAGRRRRRVPAGRAARPSAGTAIRPPRRCGAVAVPADDAGVRQDVQRALALTAPAPPRGRNGRSAHPREPGRRAASAP